MDLALLFQARKYLKVKAHSPGSIKFGVSPTILGDARFKSLTAGKPDTLPKGILAVDISVFTMSVTVRYDAALIPLALLDELFATADPARGQVILAELDQRLGLGLACPPPRKKDAMLTIDIPGFGELRLEHLVLDLNGTLAVDGVLLPGVAQRLETLARSLSIHLITADTHGLAQPLAESLPVTLTVIAPENQDSAKGDYVQALGSAACAALGNGRNDALMLAKARLGIALLQAEGAATDAVGNADVLSLNITDALDLLLRPKRLIATLRR